jgi:hypothetical protein
MSTARRSVLIALVVLIPLAYWLFRDTAPSGGIDLIDTFQEAEKRPPDGTFILADQTLGGETHAAIETKPESRIIWRVRLPRDAWLRTWIALKPETWEGPGDGVLFRIGVSDGVNYDQLLNEVVNPAGNPDDRRWIPINLDLAAYAGQPVEVIFNTNASPPGAPVDYQNDLALWGAPEVYVR